MAAKKKIDYMAAATRGLGAAGGAAGGALLQQKVLAGKLNPILSGLLMIGVGTMAPVLVAPKSELAQSIGLGVASYGGVILSEKFLGGATAPGNTVEGIGEADTYLVQDVEWEDVSGIGSDDDDDAGVGEADDEKAGISGI